MVSRLTAFNIKIMVTPEDFNTHMYPELIDAISREDDEVLMDAIASAEGQAMGYLSRFDTDFLFGAEEGDRDPTLLMHVKDIAVWHFIALANASTDMELRKTRYDDALRWLKDIQSGKVVPKWKLAETEQESTGAFHVSSAPKRPTRW